MSLAMDKLFKSQGSPGKYLLLVYLLVFLNYIPISFNNMGIVFFIFTYPYKCNVTDDGASIYNVSVNFTWNKCLGENLANNKTVKCSGGWIYDLPPHESSLVSEWDLVCDRAYMVGMITTVYFLGVLIGGLISGPLADHVGRKVVMIFSLLLNVVVGASCAFMPSYGGFIALRFIQGLLVQGIQSTSYILLMELAQTKHRIYMGPFFEIFWVIGLLLMTGIAFFLREWRYLYLVLSLPGLYSIAYIRLLPESPRFLLIQKRKKKFQQNFSTMATVNGRFLDSMLLSKVFSEFESLNDAKKTMKAYTVLDLFKTANLRKWSFVMFYNWMMITMLYYGIQLSIVDMAGDRYVTFVISAITELPAYLITMFLMKKFGRRRPLIVAFILAGISCIAAGLLARLDNRHVKLLSTALALFGKLVNNITFSAIVLFTNEIFPTVLRNTAFASCAVWLRVGGMIAPQIILLGNYYEKWISPIILGSLTLVCAVNTFFLPETHNTQLPDTIEQASQSTRPFLCQSSDKTEQELMNDEHYNVQC